MHIKFSLCLESWSEPNISLFTLGFAVLALYFLLSEEERTLFVFVGFLNFKTGISSEFFSM